MSIPENNFKEIESFHGIFLHEEVQIILRGQEEVFQYFHLIPVSWRVCLEQTEYSATVTRDVWAELDKQVPSSVSLFFKRVADIGLTVSLDKRKVHGLTYLLKHQTDKGDFYEGWLGRLPASDLDITAFKKTPTYRCLNHIRSFVAFTMGFYKTEV